MLGLQVGNRGKWLSCTAIQLRYHLPHLVPTSHRTAQPTTISSWGGARKVCGNLASFYSLKPPSPTNQQYISWGLGAMAFLIFITPAH